MKGKRFNWTSDHDQFLKDNWHKMSVHQIKNALGCSWELVVKKGEQLGFSRPTSNVWSEEDMKLLRQLAPEHHYVDIAKMMNKPAKAVYVKAKKMNITLIQDYRQWTADEEEFLRDNWGRVSLVKLAMEMKRSIDSLKVKGKRMKLGALDENDFNVLKISEIEELLNVSRKIIMENWRSKGLNIKKKWVTPEYGFYNVKVKDLWQFLEDNQDVWHASYLEENILGEEPEWLMEKRESDLLSEPVEYRNWTSEELKKARDYLELGFNYEQIADKINRSPLMVAWKIRQLGLSYQNKFYWQEDEEDLLRENYLEKTGEELAKQLKRTPRAIRSKARNLGLKKKLTRGSNDE